uniref:Uncharacterized protein n=1 Tax=viral metagenome TaxID=1070528 RepID=A0A6C0BDF7_9ZZZZ
METNDNILKFPYFYFRIKGYEIIIYTKDEKYLVIKYFGEVIFSKILLNTDNIIFLLTETYPLQDSLKLIYNKDNFSKSRNNKYAYNVAKISYDIIKRLFISNIGVIQFKKLQSVFIKVSLSIVSIVKNLDENVANIINNTFIILLNYGRQNKMLFKSQNEVKILLKSLNEWRMRSLKLITIKNLEESSLQEILFYITNADKIITDGCITYSDNKLKIKAFVGNNECDIISFNL